MTSAITGETYSLAPKSRTAAKHRVSFENAPEAEIVRRAQAGDQSAFTEIIERHQNLVFSVAYRMVRRRIDAEDVAQQVFAKIFFAMKKFDMRSSLSTWIYKIALNESYDYLRRLKKRRVIYEGDMNVEVDEIVESSERAADPRPALDEQFAKRDLLMKLLEKASAEERMLLFQKEVEGRTVEELSELTGINENTIKVKLFRARKKLAKAARQLEAEAVGGIE
jgi:RNA polymerase sigma-70 factor (ECF subfamily)